MPVSTSVIVGGSLLVVGVGLIIAALFQRMSVEPRYCKGSLVPWWWRIIFIPGWFLRWGCCRYDLGHLARDQTTGIGRCPECGFTVKPNTRLWHSTFFLRIGRFGALLVLASPIAWFVLVDGSVKRDMVRRSPTWTLIVGETVLGPLMPAFPRDELRRRFRNHDLSPWERRAAARLMRNDLLDDDRLGNAADALRWYSAQEHQLAIEELTPLLSSTDWQSRHMAAELLRDLNVEPFPLLLEVTLEGLYYGDLPGNPRSHRDWRVVDSAERGFRYFLIHPNESRPFVERGLASNDAAQQFICAVVAAHVGYEELYDEVIPIMLFHLRDNEVYWDAAWAADALLQIGERVVPHLEEVEMMDDAQARQIATHLIWRLSPPEERATGMPPLPPRADIADLDTFDPMESHVPYRWYW